MLAQFRSAGLFHAEAFRDRPRNRRGLAEQRETGRFADWPSRVHPYKNRDPLPSVRPGDAAQIQYTSGTTGFPKGALLHHRGMVANAQCMMNGTWLPARGTMVSAVTRFGRSCVSPVLAQVSLLAAGVAVPFTVALFIDVRRSG